MLRLSTAPQATITRSEFTRTATTPGTVSVERGAKLLTAGSLSIDATRDTLIDPGAMSNAPGISVASSRISFGAAPAGQAGLVFTPALLQQLQSTHELALRSYSSMDFYGDVQLGGNGALAQLTLDAAALTGNGTVGLRADAITLVNTGAVAPSSAIAGTGTLALAADRDSLTLGAGNKSPFRLQSCVAFFRARDRRAGRGCARSAGWFDVVGHASDRWRGFASGSGGDRSYGYRAFHLSGAERSA